MTYQLSIFSQHSYCHFAGETSLAKTLPFAHSHLPKKSSKWVLEFSLVLRGSSIMLSKSEPQAQELLPKVWNTRWTLLTKLRLKKLCEWKRKNLPRRSLWLLVGHPNHKWVNQCKKSRSIVSGILYIMQCYYDYTKDMQGRPLIDFTGLASS